jgi:hypothetical protein
MAQQMGRAVSDADDVAAIALTREEHLRAIRDQLASHAKHSIDSAEFEAAALLVSCCEGVSEAIGKLEDPEEPWNHQEGT